MNISVAERLHFRKLLISMLTVEYTKTMMNSFSPIFLKADTKKKLQDMLTVKIKNIEDGTDDFQMENNSYIEKLLFALKCNLELCYKHKTFKCFRVDEIYMLIAIPLCRQLYKYHMYIVGASEITRLMLEKLIKKCVYNIITKIVVGMYIIMEETQYNSSLVEVEIGPDKTVSIPRDIIINYDNRSRESNIFLRENGVNIPTIDTIVGIDDTVVPEAQQQPPPMVQPITAPVALKIVPKNTQPLVKKN